LLTVYNCILYNYKSFGCNLYRMVSYFKHTILKTEKLPEQTYTGSLARTFGAVNHNVCHHVFAFFGLLLGQYPGIPQRYITGQKSRGSVGFYRQNVMNFYLIVSDETYNANYNTFYIFEALYLTTLVMSFLIFDIVLVTLCIALCSQMQMICSAFKSVGHKSLYDSHSSTGEYDF